MINLTNKIIRSKRKTIALVITKNAELEVRAPFRTPLELIEKFILKKKFWIEKKKDLVRKKLECIFEKKFEDNEEFMYEGILYKLKFWDFSYIDILEDSLCFPKKFLHDKKNPRNHLTIWYKTRAFEKIVDRINYYANITQLKYKDIKLTNAERLWGSCTHKGVIRISWRLIMTHSDILDYVVVHELIHLIEKNHSKHFWDKVKTILPNYKEHKKWLRQHGHSLVI